MAASSSSSVQSRPHNQVFVNFRGELRKTFVSHLEKALKTDGINVFIDENSPRGKDITTLFDRIEESKIALPIFSNHYTDSHWCLDELEKIKECVDSGKLVAIPIFYKVEVADVKNLKGVFGDKFWELVRNYKGDCKGAKTDKWIGALGVVTKKFGIVLTETSKESEEIDNIVARVIEALSGISIEREREIPIDNHDAGDEETAECASDAPLPPFGIETRLKQLEEKINSYTDRTFKLGLVGMPGIGKTTLTEKLYENCKGKFVRQAFLPDVRELSKSGMMDGSILRRELLRNEDVIQEVVNMKPESLKTHLLLNKSLVILDNVTSKKQMEVLLGNGDWIKKGSLIIITTSDRSVIEGEVDDIYEVHRLSARDSLQCFSHYAFGVVNPVGNFMNISKEFSEYAKGNPFALKILGGELNGQNKAHWEETLRRLAQSSNKTIQDFLKISYNELSQLQKDVFLDVACFFRSGDEYYVRCLVESDLKALASKFLINISGGRVEMHDLLYTFGKKLASALASPKELPSEGWCRLSLNHNELDALKKAAGDVSVRGIFLDMSEMKEEVSLHECTFKKMRNLWYLKLYSSHCHRQGKADCKLNFPDGIQLPLEEIRYLYWLKFPLTKLPEAFDPKNLSDLNLPYSEIEGVWDGVKETPKLKWVDLSYSSKLSNLSGLLNAESLQRLNLEGCTSLKELPKGMQHMQSLVFLNMRGCTSLRVLPNINLISMKTLILTNCSILRTFKLISNNLENLHLDGTAITQLPTNMWKLQRLIVLNLKDCEKLEAVPKCLGKLKALQELVLSGCSKLSTFPVPIEKMKSLQILLLDGTDFSTLKVEDIPELRRSMNGISSLQRLCLSRNDTITNLQDDISLLCHLKLLDLKFCKNLISIPLLPPNLEILDAHGCDKLKTVATPLAILKHMEKVHSKFIFTNCNSLEQAAKNSITTYAQRKSQLDARRCYKEGHASEALFITSFPGSEVPSWFDHRMIGPTLNLKFPPHWCDNRLSTIVLCAVVSFQDEINSFSVECTCEFTNELGTCTRFSCILGGGWIEPRKIDSDHVFIGYTSCSHITNHVEGSQGHQKCVPTTASIKFKVIDGSGEIMNCGLSLVYEEPNHVVIEGDSNGTSSGRDLSVVESTVSSATRFLSVVLRNTTKLRSSGSVLFLVLSAFSLVLLVQFVVQQSRRLRLLSQSWSRVSFLFLDSRHACII
ncbi:disease resistance protein RPS4-like isoform X1 [Raphanus sativus]|uniref:ADP-ribosyl cyclase/cyclic ADP-ribose hydrolase n=1 Tax=Raphanus sativus TaxID=3726 RepID=A0A9W3C8M9_RAPSA|nr:disease resistance protein RPS4-like isoform X1 [Raphanus sativus]